MFSRCSSNLHHQRGGANASGGYDSCRASFRRQLDEVPVGRTSPGHIGFWLTAAALVTQSTPQRTNGTAKVMWHKAVNERVDWALEVRKQMYNQLSTNNVGLTYTEILITFTHFSNCGKQEKKQTAFVTGPSYRCPWSVLVVFKEVVEPYHSNSSCAMFTTM